MASVMLAALAGLGAADHLRSVAEALLDRGHRVTVVTAERALPAFDGLAIEPCPVAEEPWPELPQALPPLAQRAREVFGRVQQNIIDPMPAQWDVVRAALDRAQVDVVVTDALFLGASMSAVLPPAQRPPVIMLGCHPPWIPDPEVPPFGIGAAPADDGTNRVRSAVLELVAARAYTRLSRRFNEQIERTFGVHRRGDLRAAAALADAFLQLTVPRFEYPRRALPGNFRFIGPLRAPASAPLPDWWSPLDEPRVIAVRADGDAAIRDLVEPTVRAFGRTEDTVIVAGVDRSAVEAALPDPLPSNVHFEPGLPWSRLIPRRTVVVSNADYLFTQDALRYAVPLVVAGTYMTDVETAARVAWAGAGVDLRTRRPTAEDVRAAVERVRADDSYGVAAARIAVQIAGTDAEATICDLVAEHASRRVDGPTG